VHHPKKLKETSLSTFRVAIVGAGPVGMTAALLLIRQGVVPVIFERREGIADLPQAHVVNTRSSEIFRELGIYGKVVEAASPVELSRAITWRDAAAGTCFGSLGMENDVERSAAWRKASPVRDLNIGQDVLGQILLDELEAAGGSVAFRHTVEAAEVEGEKAVLQVRLADGDVRRETFDVVLACDGASSATREALGIKMKGPASLAKFVTCYFKAEINHLFGDCTGAVHFLGGADVCGSLISFDLKDTWALMCVIPPDATREQFSESTMLELVRRAIGDPSIEPKLISVGGWNMSAQVAEEFRRGPYYLVGDSAHRFPPSGGLGLNTGVQDAHNLVWKLVKVANGSADAALLDTYSIERMPVASSNCEQSAYNAMNLAAVDAAVGAKFLSAVDVSVLGRPAVDLAAQDYGIHGDSEKAKAKRQRIAQAILKQRPHFGALRIDIGYRYGEIPPLVGTKCDELPGVAVGARLPHCWLDLDGKRVSSLDLAPLKGYRLLTRSGNGDVADLARHLESRQVSVRVLPDCELFSDEIPAVLVRPDGHILWCGTDVHAGVFEAIERLHAGEIQRDVPPVKTISESEKATMSIAPKTGIRPAKLAHVVLRTSDRFDEMCDWYRDLLNAEFVHRDPMTCFMTYDDEHHRVAVIRVPDAQERPAGTVGVEHFAFTYSSLSDLLENYARLKQQGTTPMIAINHGMTTSIYYEDPDRNRLELQVDNFDTPEAIEGFFKSGVMNANPVGVRFNPDDLLARLRAGESDESLMAYPADPGPVDMAIIERLSQN
jgi:2,4-dichlorophenol 6-monooxygenase